jgi:hypothetical protein
MQKLKINFVDFWPGFIANDNYFYNLLSTAYTIELSENPDFIFYSCYGNEYLKYNCIKIFYTPENERPDFTACDFAFSFDYLNDKRHFRLPLYVLYIDRANCLDTLLQHKTIDAALALWRSKTKFCCMVVSNPNSKKRIDFFKFLSSKCQVDSGGKYMNNVGGAVEDKLAFIKDYKFVISFENSSRNGYTTEKIIEPFMVNSIPIYWGNKRVNNEINGNAFININNFSNYNQVYDKMLKIEKDDNLASQYLMCSKFTDATLPSFLDKKQVLNFLINIFNDKETIPVVSISFYRYIHFCKRKVKTGLSILKSKTIGHYR